MRARQSLALAFGLLFALSALVFAASPVPVSATSESFLWGAQDVKGLDPWGDAGDDVHDLIAVYAKEAVGLLHFRADVMDARDDSRPDLFLAIDYRPGGENALIEGQAAPASDLEWDLLLSLSGSGEAHALDFDFADRSEFVQSAAFDTTLDYAEWAIAREALPDWDGSPFSVQALALDASGSLADATSPASTAETTGRGKLALLFGNMFYAPGPDGISWYDGFRLDPERRPGERRGYKYLLDAVEQYEVPLTVIDLRDELLPGLEYLGIHDRLRGIAARGLLDLLDTLTYGYFMPWQPADVDARAIQMMRADRAAFGFAPSRTFYPYEAMLTAGDLAAIRDAGYPAVFSLDRLGYWFGWIEDWGNPEEVQAWHTASRKIHRIDGVLILPGAQGYAWDPRWDRLGIEPGWFLLDYSSFEGTDGGLHHGWRRVLLDLALDPDQEQYMTMGTDLNLTSWSFQSDVEASLGWIAAHPWIEPATLDDLASRGWTPIEHGDLGLTPDEPLERFLPEGDLHYNAYFWQMYAGGIADGHSPFIAAGTPIEGYADYVPVLRDGQPIPSGRTMGDDESPGTIVYETLRALRAAPDNALATLAWRAYFMSIAEQTFHSQVDFKPSDAFVEAWGGQYMDPAAKGRANLVGQVNKIVAAARWAEETAGGGVSAEAEVLVQDLDLDGEAEFVLRNDRVFAIFENDGGRLEYAFAFDPATGPLQLVGREFEVYVPFTTDFGLGETPTANPSPEGAFEDTITALGKEYRYEAYTVEPGADELAFVSPDGRIRKTLRLEGETLSAHYLVEGTDPVSIGFALPAGMGRMHARDWWQAVAPLESEQGRGWGSSEGELAVVNFLGTNFDGGYSFLASPVREEMRERQDLSSYSADYWAFFPFNAIWVAGSGEFDVSLTLSAKTAKSATAPTAQASTPAPEPSSTPGSEGPSGPGPFIAIGGALALVAVAAGIVFRRRGR